MKAYRIRNKETGKYFHSMSREDNKGRLYFKRLPDRDYFEHSDKWELVTYELVEVKVEPFPKK